MEAEKETTQSKSNAVSEDAPLTEESSVTKSPDTVNGEDTVESVEKTEGEDEASVEMKDKPVEESEKVEETVREEKSRKRKAPADDSLSEESSGETRGDAKEESPVAPTLIREESVKPVGSDEIPVLEQLADLSMPPKQTLGKGKRARIPNKRYSDILLSPQSRSHKSSVENGEKVSDRLESESEFNDKDEESTNTSLKPQPSTNTPAPKKAKLSVDLSSPAYKVPFTCGWRRELVYRNGSDLTKKIMGDIYYYSPGGKKIRSMREMIDHLKTESGELSSVNFTFYREPLGLDDPAKELVRPAKQWSKKSRGGLKSPKVANTAKSPRASPRANDTPAEAVTASPKARTSTRNLGNIKVKLPPAKTKAEKLKEKEEAMEAEPTPTRRQGTRRSAKMPSNLEMESKPCQPCSIRCEGVLGMVPTLQCRICLCLYHYECIGLSPHAQTQPFVCKNCQLEHGQNVVPPASSIALPPLTPINTLKTMTAQSTVLPKLQRIPRSGDSASPHEQQETKESGVVVPNMPRLLPLQQQTMPKLAKDAPSPPKQQKMNNTENKSLVGSVTSWLPHSSTIQVDNMQKNKENEPVQAPRPQYVEYLAGRKFLIIPKHNVVSISPTINKPQKQLRLLPEPENNDVNVNNTHVEEKVINSEEMEVTTSNGDDNNGGGDEVVTDKEKENQTEDKSEAVEPPKAKRRSTKANSVSSNEKIEEPKFMDSYLQNLSYGYSTLLHVFQYLKVQDLLRAGCVCTMWRDIASHPSLWRTVRMKNSQVHSFEGLANSLQKHGTVQLDLRKMLLPASGNSGDDIWPEFSKAIEKVETLRKIELCRCPASVVQSLLETNRDLEVINAVTIKCESIDLEKVSSVKNLKELRIKSTGGLTLTSDITSLKELTNLMHLSLTSIKSLHKLDLSVIASLTKLETLDLGECNDFPENFGAEILIKLDKLEKLRLEKGQGNCHTFEILEAVQNMPQLEQLELVNFDIKGGFDTALGACANIKKLLIIPTYISQSATTNHMVLGGVLRLQTTLSYFVWGVTLELLRVTELFVDQCEDPDMKEKKEKKPTGSGDSIPVLKPVPSIINSDDSILPAHDPPQVEILPLPNLQKLLLQSLPTTRVKILKIPFHATWRQSITDTVN